MAIKDQIAAIRRKIKQCENDIKRFLLDIEQVRIDCPHENVSQHVINYANERWWECDDCGKENP